MYCSDECLKESERIDESQMELRGRINFHHTKKALYLSGGYEQLGAMLDDPTKHTIYNYDLSNPNDPQTKANLLRCFFSVPAYPATPSASARISDYQFKIDELLLPYWKKEVISKFTMRVGLMGSESGLMTKDICRAIPLFASLIRRSCDPNVYWVAYEKSYVVIVNRPLKRGDQLFILLK